MLTNKERNYLIKNLKTLKRDELNRVLEIVSFSKYQKVFYNKSISMLSAEQDLLVNQLQLMT